MAQGSQPAFGGQSSAGGGKPIFGGQLPLGTEAVFGSQTPAGSQSAFGGQAVFGSLTSTGSQPVFGGQTSAGGQLTFGGQAVLGSLSALGNQTQTVFGSQTSSGGQLAFGGQIVNTGQPSAGQSAQAIPSSKGQPHPMSLTTAGSSGQLPFGAVVQSTAQVRPPSGPAGILTAASGDGPRPQLTFGGLRGQTDLGFQPPKPAEQHLNLAAQTMPSTAGGVEQVSLFSKQLPSYSQLGSQKPLETPAAAPKMAPAALPDLARGLQTPVATSIFGTSLNLGKPLDHSTPAHSIQAVVKPSTTTATLSSFSFPAQPKPTAQPSAAAKGLVSVTAGKSPAGPTTPAAVTSFGAKAYTTKSDTQESGNKLYFVSHCALVFGLNFIMIQCFCSRMCLRRD